MIVTKVFREPKEGKDHFHLKKRVGQLADRYFTNLAKPQFDVTLWHEFQFPVIITSLGPRAYIADILVFFSDPKIMGEGIQFVINIEIDGFEGHSSRTEIKKNRVRDIALEKGVTFGKKTFPILTKRILVDGYTDEEILLELHDVYINTLKLYNSQHQIL